MYTISDLIAISFVVFLVVLVAGFISSSIYEYLKKRKDRRR